LRLADRRRLKSREVAISSDQLAGERNAETIGRYVEVGWQGRKIIELQASADVAQIPNTARKDAPQAWNGSRASP
jgi:hypothetical protein